MNQIKHRRPIALAILVVAFALVAAACSSSDSDTTTTEGTEAPATTVAPDAPTTTAAPTEPTEPVEPPTPANRLSGLTVVDDLTFTAELNVADPELPLWMYYTAYLPLPSVAYDNTLGYNNAPIGNGPYMFPEEGEWEHDTQIALVSNPDYAGDAPANDGVTFRISADIGTDYLEALDGNLDVLTNIDPDRLAAAPTDFPDRFAQSPNTGILYMAFPSYLDDTFTEAHRQALSMSIDRELIIEKIFNGSGVAAHSAVPSNLGGRDDVCEFWNYDPDAAKAIWDAAGPLEGFDVWFNAGSGHEDWVGAVVNMWGNALGIDTAQVTFQSAEWADYLDHADNGEFTGPFRLGWGMDYPSPLNFLEPLYASYMTAADGGSNASEHNDPAFDEALAQGKDAIAASGNSADAVPFYEGAEDLLCKTARTMPIRFSLNQFVWNETVSDVYLNAFGNLDVGTVVDSDDGNVSMEITEPASLFPMDTNESEGTQVLQEGLFTGLVKFDAVSGESYMAAAESITSEDGGKTWTFVLKPGWTFHNGEPVTAASYVDAWSFGARSELGFQNNGFYKRFVGYDELNAG